MKISKLILGAAIIVSSTVSYASTNHVINNPYLNNLSIELDLTEDQKVTIQDIYSHYKNSFEKMPISFFVDIREQQFELLTEETLDRDSISNFIDNIHKHEKNMVMNEMEFKNTVFNILNDQQKAKLSRMFYKDLSQANRAFK